jgi:hypothetical protein
MMDKVGVCVCAYCGQEAEDETYVWGRGAIHHDVSCKHCGASYGCDDYSQCLE